MATMRITMKQRLLGQEMRNTFHVSGGDAVQANAQGIIDYFASVWSGSLTASLSLLWSLYGASAKELDVVSNPTIEYNLTAGTVTGVNTNNLLPTTVAGLVSWVALTARPNRGRTYLAGWTRASFDANGRFVASDVTNMQTWATSMLGVNIPYPGLGMVVARISKPSGVLVGSNLINSARVLNVSATMRSRREGSGI